MKKIATVILLVISFHLSAQDWVNNQPVSVKGNKGPYKYFVGVGTSYADAQLEAIKTIAAQGGVEVSSIREKSKEIENLVRKTKRSEKTTIDFGDKSLEVIWLEQAYEGDKYYALYAVPTKYRKAGNTPGRLGSGQFVWRSVLAPGWGQFYNKQSSKGLLFALGEVALIGGTLYSFGQAGTAKDNASLSRIAGDLASYNRFNNRKTNWQTTGTIVGVGAVALWVLNIVDAASSKKKRYAYNHTPNRLQFYAHGDGLGLKYNLSK